ncbi:MAG: iron chelate uptake ABC transporter family permease subunit [Actinomycetaceae bacterium]|nr:iron chelate uptake ABC transporter family permease subunit [Actinomycetaceae bacterium]
MSASHASSAPSSSGTHEGGVCSSRRLHPSILVVIGMVAIALAVIASVSLGAREVSLSEILGGIFGSSQDLGAIAVRERLPRTVIALVVGAALSLAGVLMQSLTRNPVADPGILGINMGASLAIVMGIAFLGLSSLWQYLWLALAGAILTALFVQAVGSAGPGGQTPVKLALAGVATSAALSSVVSAILLPRAQIMEDFRFWQVGSLGRGTWETLGTIAPFLIIGALAALIISSPLDSLALGEEMAIGLGVNVPLTRAVAALSGVLLCAASTAVAGPIGFVGLMIPHVIRLLIGPSHLWLMILSSIGGATLLTFSDVIGRILLEQGEVPVGVITAFIGAPILILIARSAKVRTL